MATRLLTRSKKPLDFLPGGSLYGVSEAGMGAAGDDFLQVEVLCRPGSIICWKLNVKIRDKPMKFNDLLEGNVVIFEISGKIMGGDETTMFHGRIHEYINQNKNKVLVDLAKVDWMNSVGLGMFISAMTTVKNSGGRFALVNISKIESILVVTRLITVFEHFDTREEAMKALNE
ncbi:MAG: STAS domain-containing protein [bacterium]